MSSKCPVLNVFSMWMSGSLKKDAWSMNVERIYEQKRENNKSIYKIVKINRLVNQKLMQVVNY